MLNTRFPVQLHPGTVAAMAYAIPEKHVKTYDLVMLVNPVQSTRMLTVMGPRGNLFDVYESWFKWELLQKPM